MDPDAFAGRHRDADVVISIAEDGMSVTADFYPPLGEGRPLSSDFVENLLMKKSIVYGIDWETITSTIEKTNRERRNHKSVVIARGREPVDQVPEHLKLKNDLVRPNREGVTEELTIDYKEFSPFVIVKKGEVLGETIEAQEGIPGISVKNEEVSSDKKTVEQITLGSNVELEHGKILATVNGRFVQKKNVISIVEVLEIESGVDYHTGNIIFPGDVIIKGEVKDGFKVYSGGSIVCYDTLDAYDVVSKQDLVAQVGIIGRGKGSLRVGGTVQAKFIENCQVKAKNTISIEDELLNSRLYTSGALHMGERGRIIGGETCAINGIEAFETGNKRGQYTSLQCGVDFISQKKFDSVKKRHTALNLKLQTVESLSLRYNRHDTSDLITKIKDELERLMRRMNALLEKINSNEEAIISVAGTAYPGTTIDICHYHFVVLEPLHRVRFHLDKTLGKVVPQTHG